MNIKLPPLTKFHIYLCSLNFYNDFIEKPLNVEEDNPQMIQTQEVATIKHIPLQFDSYDEYIKVWEKLFFIEARAQILKARYNEVDMIISSFVYINLE